MEESQEILLNSLAKSGVEIPAGVSTIGDLTPSMLISVCINAVRLIDTMTSLPASLPAEDLLISDRFKISSDLASAFKTLGFIGDLSFHNFLYPSEEDFYKLVGFLVEKLPSAGETRKDVDKKDVIPSGASREECDFGGQIHEDGDKTKISIEVETKEVADGVDASTASGADSCKKGLAKDDRGLMRQIEDLKCRDRRDEGMASPGEEDGPENQRDSDSLRELSFEINRKIGKLRCEEELLMAELNRRSSELQHLHDDHEMLKSVLEVAFDDEHPLDFYIKQLDDQIEAKRKNLAEVESQWGATRASLEEKQRSLEEAFAAKFPEAFEKLRQVNRVKLETEAILAETKEREEELSKLSADLENQPQLAPRRSYIERIKEITKNSQKLDTDIERILRETRELQLESNIVQERLHRTYVVVDEMVFREAKKYPVVEQAYRHLTSIHESFEQIAEKTLATDRARREVIDYEAKLAALTSRSLNLDKLEADLYTIRKENDLLEQRLHNG